MTLTAALRALARRWYVLVPLLLLVGAGAVFISLDEADTFEATGSVLFADSAFDPARQGVDIAASDLQQYVTAPSTRSALDGVDDEIIAFSSTAVSDAPPAVSVSIVSTDAADAQAALTAIRLGLPEALRQRLDIPDTIVPVVAQDASLPDREQDGTTSVSAIFSVTLEAAEQAQASIAAGAPTLRVVQERMDDPRVANELADGFGITDVDFNLIDRDAAPIGYVVVAGTDREQTLAGYGAAVEQVRAIVSDVSEELQTNLPDVIELNEPREAEATSGQLSRAAVGFAAAGTLAAVAIALVLDRLLSGRRRRRAERRRAVEAAEAEQDGAVQVPEIELDDRGEPVVAGATRREAP